MSNVGFETVLDLPQLYTHPSAEELISTLEHLALKPLSWDLQSRSYEPQDQNIVTINESGLPNFFTSIIASSLSWIHENRRDEVWEAASKRLSERSGRTAMPSVSRTFVIPHPSSKSSISISLHEPSLTSDNLGHKTWLASYLLAKRLPYLIPHLPMVRLRSELAGSPRSATASIELPYILELGAGTGLVGLAAAAVFSAANVHLTDLPAIIPNLQNNVSHNIHPSHEFDECGNVTVGVLDWSKLPTDAEHRGPVQKYDLILAADPLYSPLHPMWLVNTIALFLKRDQQARVIVELPLREVYESEVKDFKMRMSKEGFCLVADGEEVGVEDWGGCSAGGDQMEVKCWWGVWKREDEKN